MTPQRTSLQFKGAGVSLSDDSVNQHTVVTIPGIGGSLAVNPPPQIASAGAVGILTTIAREDHTHAHGAQTDGTMHAVAVAGGANGFMSGTDKTFVNAINGGAGALVTPNAITFPAADATPAVNQAQATAGAGVALTVQAQQGFTGNVGGNLVLKSGAGAVAGTNAAGQITLDVGSAVGGVSTKVSLQSAASEFSSFWKDTSGVSTAVWASAMTRLRLQAGNSFILNDGTAGTTGDTVTFSLFHGGGSGVTWGAGITSLTDSIAQNASGAGVSRTLAGQSAATGAFVGGDLFLKVGAGGNASTAAGTMHLDVGALVSNASSPVSFEANGVQWLKAYQSSAGGTSIVSPIGILTLSGSTSTTGISISTVVSMVSPFYVSVDAPAFRVFATASAAPMFEYTELAAAQRVVGMFRNGTLSTTNMPTGSGDGVMNIANAIVVPTANCDNTGIVLYATSGQLHTRDFNGYTREYGIFDTILSPNGTGATAGAARQIAGQAGQTQTGVNNNNNGGAVQIGGGSPGTGGSGTAALYGPVQIGFGPTLGGGILVEAAGPLSANNRVVSLARITALTSTNMPANTGDGVINVGNCNSEPSANCDNTGVIVYAAGARLKARETNGYVSELVATDSSGGPTATHKNVLRRRGRVNTTSTSTTLTVVSLSATDINATTAGVIVIDVDLFCYDTVKIASFYGKFMATLISNGTTVSQVGSLTTIQTINGITSAPTLNMTVASNAINFTITPGNTDSTDWTIRVTAENVTHG